MVVVLPSVFLFLQRLTLLETTGEGHLVERFPHLANFLGTHIESITGKLTSFDDVKHAVGILGIDRFGALCAEKAAVACVEDPEFDILAVRLLIDLGLESIVIFLAPYTAEWAFVSKDNWVKATEGLDEIKSPLFEDVLAVYTFHHMKNLPADIFARQLSETVSRQIVALNMGSLPPRSWFVFLCSAPLRARTGTVLCSMFFFFLQPTPSWCSMVC